MTIGFTFHFGRFLPTLGVPIPALIGPSQQFACNVFYYDSYGHHLQTYQVKSTDSQVHDWFVCTRRLPPSCTLITDFTLTHNPMVI
jgi:hypothetical protein